MGVARHRPTGEYRLARRPATPRLAPNPARYRIMAMSAGCCSPPDLILADERGNTYLMMPSERRLYPLTPAERDALGLFYESVINMSWHSLAELRGHFSDV